MTGVWEVQHIKVMKGPQGSRKAVLPVKVVSTQQGFEIVLLVQCENKEQAADVMLINGLQI